MTDNITKLLEVDLTGEYTKDFEEAVENAFEELTQETVEYRLTLSEVVIDRYVSETGERPTTNALSRLAHAILYDDMEGDERSNKSQVVEYPILTDAQYARRTKGDNFKTNQAETSREVYVDISYLASDGRDYRPPVRRDLR